MLFRQGVRLIAEAPAPLEAVERLAQEACAAIGRAAVSAVVNLAGEHPPARAACPNPEHAGQGRARLVQPRTKTIRTLLGAVEVTRGYYHCKGCKHGFAPLDGRLQITASSLSPGLARAAALAGAEMPYAKSFEFIATVTGLDLTSASTLARTTRREGTRARTLIDTEHAAARPGPVPAADIGGMGLCYIVIDGTGAPVLPRETAGRAGKDGKRAGTREVKIGAFFTQSHLDPATSEPVQDEGSASYISTFAPAPAFAAQAKAEYHRRGFDQIRQPVVLGDGARWIWNIANTHFPAATQIVDYFHAREHLADLTKHLSPVLEDPKTFEQLLVDALDLGDVDDIAHAVEQLDLASTAPDLVKPAAKEVGYFTTNRDRMRCTEFKAGGYYIGSGPVESACNTIVKQRAKRAGMHWTINGLDPVLALRTLHQSHRDHILWPATATPPQS